MHPLPKALLLVPALLALPASISRAGHPSQGLWVGEVELNAVNEATGAVGDSNTYEFTDPQTLTPTSDTAFLRLILHVNGAGQATLLKSVAILENDEDILLITDPKLYPQYPGIARRIASAAFDFGDQQAVTAVQTLIDNSTSSAVTKAIAANGGNANTIETAVLAELQNVVSTANVNSAYLNRTTGASSFLTTSFFSQPDVVTLANAVASLIHNNTRTAAQFAFNPATDGYAPFPTDPLGGNFAAIVNIAKALRDSSFYMDTRGLEAIAGVCFAAANAAAANPSADLATKEAAAASAAVAARHNAADVTQAYNRFIAGTAFNAIKTAIPDVAVAAALDSKSRGRDEAQITSEVTDAFLQNSTIAAAITAAVTLKSASLWGDDRAENTTNAVLATVAAAAAAQVTASIEPTALREAVDNALTTAFEAVQAAPVFSGAPSSEYTGFVTGTSYSAAAATAARSAAAEAVFQYRAGFTSRPELEFLTKRAVNKALTAVRNTAAALPQNELPLNGSLAPGGSIAGTLHLPALAPTNPFMHRRHPDHTEGFPITRKIGLTFDATGDGQFGRSGYGVSRITGTYSEEIFGLHKPLGPNKDIGLRTRGTFTLNRLTFAESLNF
jgi:hypothetical protein